MPESHLTLALVSIVVLGVGAQWLAWRLRWPAIVVLMLFGLAAGPLTGLLVPQRDLGELVSPVVKLFVAVILFEGGLTLRWHEFLEAKGGVRRLLFPALPLNWVFGSLAAHYIGGVSWPVALVFGAIIVVTGPTVIIPLLRQAGLRRRPASYLKWEGIINDPIGALLAVLVFQFFTAAPEDGAWQIIAKLSVGAAAAIVLGYAAARLIALLYRRGWTPEYLKSPVLLMVVFVVFTAADMVHHESGLLATTVMGLTLANIGLADIEELRRFKEYLTVLMVSTVFIVLTAGLDTEALLLLDWRLIALIGAVLFLVRPAAIFLATFRSDMTLNERALVAWIAPRGIVAAAVAGVFGPAMVEAGYEDAAVLVPLIFTLILATVVLHGFSLRWLGRKLGLAASERRGLLIVGATPWSVELARTLKSLDIPVIIADSSWAHLRQVRLGGIEYFYGEILTESAEARLDLSDIGYLLAVTDNDAYNALVCSRFVPTLGREFVYQLPISSDVQPRQLQNTVTGRVLFGEAAYYEVLLSRYYRGWRFQKTPITQGYSAQDYFERVGEEAMPFLLVRASGKLVFRHGDVELKPEPGDSVVAFISPEAQKERRSARSDAADSAAAAPGP